MALLIIYVFQGQMTEPVLNILKEYNICLVIVPAIMTDIFQPLDLTVNRSVKSFFKRSGQGEEVLLYGLLCFFGNLGY